MNTVTLPASDYKKLLKRQDEAEEAIAVLKGAVEVLSRDEVTPAVAARLARQSKLMDAGKDTRFSSMKAFRAHVKAL